MLDIGTSAVGFGCFYGVILQSKFFKGMSQYVQPQKNLLLKILGRLGVTLGISTPILLMFLFLNSNSITNIYLLLILKTLIPLFVATTLMFGVSDEANLKLGLYEPLLD